MRSGNEVVGAGRLSFVERCAYPDGCHVMSAMTLELGYDGRIARHLTVQAWDEVSCSTRLNRLAAARILGLMGGEVGRRPGWRGTTRGRGMR